jgi:carbon monoxide dehydrogenase subunit G
MNFEHTFHISAPANVVWTCLKDVPTILTHIPGAQFSGSTNAQTHSAAFTIAAGPARGTYDFHIAVQSLDDSGRTAVVTVSGDDAAGKGSVRATLRLAVQPAGAGSDVMLRADIDMPGATTQSAISPGAGVPGLHAGPAAGLPPEFASTANQFVANLERALGR